MKGLAILAVVLLAASGCYGWPKSDAKTVVYNETDAPAVVHVTVLDGDGRTVHEDTIEAGPQSRVQGKGFHLSGTYTVQATAGPLSSNETVQLGSSTNALRVHVRDSHLEVGVGTP